MVFAYVDHNLVVRCIFALTVMIMLILKAFVELLFVGNHQYVVSVLFYISITWFLFV